MRPLLDATINSMVGHELSLCCHLQCAEIAEHLAGDMARENLKGKTLTLKLKSTAFEVRSRAHSLPQHISTASEIEAVALRLLKAELPIEIRLMGMRMSHFLEVRKEAGQQSIASFVRQSLHDVEGDLSTPYLNYMLLNHGTVATQRSPTIYVPIMPLPHRYCQAGLCARLHMASVAC